jgi:Uma2 family endonuclease
MPWKHGGMQLAFRRVIPQLLRQEWRRPQGTQHPIVPLSAKPTRQNTPLSHNGLMATVSVPRSLTADEYAVLPEVVGFRDELIEGERVLSPMPKLAHVLILDRLSEILERQLHELAPDESLTVVREAGWKFRIEASGAESVPGPDLMVVRNNEVRRALQSNGWYEGVPLLVVEVISPSERKSRRLQKVGLYLEMGVPHVVEVDYTRRVVRVHTPESDAVAMYGQDDQMTVPFRGAVAEIFAILESV